MKSKLKSCLRLNTVLTLACFVCGLLLGLTVPRDRKEFTASADTRNITEIPYTSTTYSLSQNSFDVYIVSSGFFNTPLVLTYTRSNSNISFFLADSSSAAVGSSLESGSTIQFSSPNIRLRVNSGLFGGGDYSFTLAYPSVTLPAPTLTITGDTLSWNAVEHTSHYAVFRDGTLIATLSPTATTYRVSTSGSYTVRALGDDPYVSSDWSNAVTYTAPSSVTLPAPTLTISGSLLSWNAIEYASAYSIFRDGTLLANVNDTTLSYNVTSSGSYTVRALGDDDYYLSSDWSNAVTYTAPSLTPLATPTLTINGDILSWNAIQHAEDYTVLCDGLLVARITGTSYQVSSSGSYTVRAYGDDVYYSPSDISNAVTYSGGTPGPVTVASPFHAIIRACSEFLGLGLFGDNRLTLGFLFSIGLGIVLLGAIIKLFFHG